MWKYITRTSWTWVTKQDQTEPWEKKTQEWKCYTNSRTQTTNLLPNKIENKKFYVFLLIVIFRLVDADPTIVSFQRLDQSISWDWCENGNQDESLGLCVCMRSHWRWKILMCVCVCSHEAHVRAGIDGEITFCMFPIHTKSMCTKSFFLSVVHVTAACSYCVLSHG